MRLWPRLSLIAGLALGITHAQAAGTAIGLWKTLDDRTGQPRALVQISERDGVLSGTVVKLFRKPDEDQNPRCEDCVGERHGQPVLGMAILWGLTREGDVWDRGEILDPESGDTYRCKLHLNHDGSKLEVRGYIGIALFGRTQVWEREGQ